MSEAEGAGTQINESDRPPRLTTRRRSWIDIDNSPPVPFFVPIVEELRKRGHEVILTARDAYQVCELLELFHLSCKVVGRHYGKNRAAKILGTGMRAAQLIPMMVGEKIDLAVSHGSRAQMMVGFALGIPTLLILDYEYIAMWDSSGRIGSLSHR